MAWYDFLIPAPAVEYVEEARQKDQEPVIDPWLDPTVPAEGPYKSGKDFQCEKSYCKATSPQAITAFNKLNRAINGVLTVYELKGEGRPHKYLKVEPYVCDATVSALNVLLSNPPQGTWLLVMGIYSLIDTKTDVASNAYRIASQLETAALINNVPSKMYDPFKSGESKQVASCAPSILDDKVAGVPLWALVGGGILLAYIMRK